MFQRILVGVDGSELSDLALDHAARLAKTCNATVEALYVIDSTDVYYNIGPYDPGRVTEAMIAFGQRLMASCDDKLSAAQVEHRTHLRKTSIAPGRVAATIVEEAREWGADLIVLGTHGRHGMQRLVLGSVAHGVLHRSACPVLLIRRHSGQRGVPSAGDTSHDPASAGI